MPDVVHSKFFIILSFFIKVCGTNQLIGFIEQLTSPIFLAPYLDMLETAIFIQRHGSVIEKIGIGNQIHSTIRKQTAHVLLQLLTIHKRIVNLVHKFPFFFSQTIRIGRIYSREICVTQRIFFAFVHKNSAFKVYLFQQLPVAHSKLRTAVYNFGFQLELDDSDRLMHLCYQAQSLLIVIAVGEIHLRHKNSTRIICISIHGESCQRQQIDSITVFKSTQIAITHGHTYHIGYATIIAGSGSHPQNIMVAPLNVEVMIIAQSIHDDVCSGTTVVYIAYDMKRINRQPLNQITHGYNKVIRPLGRDNGTDNDIDISMLVGLDSRLMQQLLNDIGKL